MEHNQETVAGSGASEREDIGLTTGQPLQGNASTLRFLVAIIAALVTGLIVGGTSIWVITFRNDQSQETNATPALPSNEADQMSSPLNFLVVGDWGREGEFNQSWVAESMGIVGEKLKVNFVVSTGDNFYEAGLTNVDDSLFQKSFSNIYTARSLQTLWYAVLGNHDYVQLASVQLDPALKLKDPRWHCLRNYSISQSVCPEANPLDSSCNSTVELFFIDTSPLLAEYWGGRLNFTHLTSQSEELNNTVKDLRFKLEKSTATWKLVIGHHPIRSMGAHGDTLELIANLLFVLEEFNVDLYLNGHDHALELIERSDSRVPLVTLGAGSKCYRP